MTAGEDVHCLVPQVDLSGDSEELQKPPHSIWTSEHDLIDFTSPTTTSVVNQIDSAITQVPLQTGLSTNTGNKPEDAPSTALPLRRQTAKTSVDLLDASPTSHQPVTHEPGNGDVEYDEKSGPDDDSVVDSVPATHSDVQSEEIQNIISQFGRGEHVPILDPPTKKGPPEVTIVPPRISSLDRGHSPHSASTFTHGFDPDCNSDDDPRASSSSTRQHADKASDKSSRHEKSLDAPPSPRNGTIFRPPPPEMDDESLPFDFHRFLEQLRHRTADPVARFLRSFLNEFSKKQWMVHEQVKIISDFLEFIAKKMAQCEVWRAVSDAEFDNAKEGMEKLVMNRLYAQTFSPMIPPPTPIAQPKTRRSKLQAVTPPETGRPGQHQEDVERDEVIAQKIRIYGWIREEHLDIPPVGDKGRKFLALAQQELLKVNSYRAPRDKIIQVLNCCKVLFGFLKNNKTDQSADSFVPLLIYTVLKANPAHLVSNVQYIQRFRNQEKLGGEAGYYLSSLSGVVGFIETLDRTNLTISKEEFERHVEAAVSAIAEGHEAEDYELQASMPRTAGETQNTLQIPNTTSVPSRMRSPSPLAATLSEKSAPAKAEVTPRNSSEAERISPRRTRTTPRLLDSIASSARTGSPPPPSQRTNTSEGNIATGIFRTIQRPISSIGRMFSDSDRRNASTDHGRPSTVYDDKMDHPTSSSASLHNQIPPRIQPPLSQTEGGSDMLRFFAGNRAASFRSKQSPTTTTTTTTPTESLQKALPLPAAIVETKHDTDEPPFLPSASERVGARGDESEEPRYGSPPLHFVRMNGAGGHVDGGGGDTGRGGGDGEGEGVDSPDGQRRAVRAAQRESVRDAEALRVRAEEHRLVVETLQGMFPDLDREVISDVVRMKQGRVGMAVDACLALST